MDILFEKVSFAYQGIGMPTKEILRDITMRVPSGEITAFIGKTGSGKTTLTQLCNGILTPTSGQIHIGQTMVSSKSLEDDLFDLKKDVGIVFQFPETQLFEKTVIDDVMFGPLNFGYSQEEARQAAKQALMRVAIDETLFLKSPFSLSGGQMRRVAIAGVLAYSPKILVFDEPTAGLDLSSKQSFWQLCQQLRQEGITIIIVSHDMDEVALLADNVAIVYDGQIVQFSDTKTIFYSEQLKNYGLNSPQVVQLVQQLEKQYGVYLKDKPITTDNLITALRLYKQGGYDE